MNVTDHRDIEERLKQFHYDPTRAKRSVMSAYEEPSRHRLGFWRRSVPLYAAAAVLVLMAAVSFVAGQRSASPREHPPAAERADESGPAAGAVTSVDIEWSVAERDLL
jgi:anti-sigma-K factor RskA